MTAHRLFERSFDSLPAIVAFTAGVFSSEGIDPSLRTVVDLAIEELFTNMVKYSTGSRADVRIEMTAIDRGVEVTLIDYDVDRFDVTARPDVDVNLPIEQRKPGGLGLHLIRRLLDSIQYEYTESSRQSRITFRKTGAVSQAADQNKGG
jgi:anti-sigma regulatory factor (Ser/Thr protein kinase)